MGTLLERLRLKQYILFYVELYFFSLILLLSSYITQKLTLLRILCLSQQLATPNQFIKLEAKNYLEANYILNNYQMKV
jgi:hypothetical protein